MTFIQKLSKHLRYARISQKISSMIRVIFHANVSKFSNLEVVALSLTAETESIDRDKWLFNYKLREYKASIPNLISRQFNDRRKKTVGLCEELRKRIAMEMDGGEVPFFVDSKSIEFDRIARGKRCKMRGLIPIIC